ncbi:hypothetical protein E2C01_021376 [Portunus trituberculatus]|uniref:Uncharacterized protein n=1 Tax=Portunus trituberculatus TaxID=210409 RepID=A0A5B7E2G2_PORTR|nr:hypothetical protein [Portunus trituberculatus]
MPFNECPCLALSHTTTSSIFEVYKELVLDASRATTVHSHYHKAAPHPLDPNTPLPHRCAGNPTSV